MADIYLHEVNDADLEIIALAIQRRSIMHYGMQLSDQRVSEERNNMIRHFLRKTAEDERSVISCYELEAENTEQEEQAISLIDQRLFNKGIPIAIVENNSIILTVPRADQQEAEATLSKISINWRQIF